MKPTSSCFSTQCFLLFSIAAIFNLLHLITSPLTLSRLHHLLLHSENRSYQMRVPLIPITKSINLPACTPTLSFFLPVKMACPTFCLRGILPSVLWIPSHPSLLYWLNCTLSPSTFQSLYFYKLLLITM